MEIDHDNADSVSEASPAAVGSILNPFETKNSRKDLIVRMIEDGAGKYRCSGFRCERR